MRRFAQIYCNKAHWIFESLAEPEFAPNVVLVDITDKPEVQEGWDYNSETGELTEPVREEKDYELVTETTLEEQIYAENLYQTALLEINLIGGM